DAAEGRAREETFVVVPGLEIVTAVRPLKDRQTAWWFTPRLAASSSPQPVLERDSQSPPAPPPAAARAQARRPPPAHPTLPRNAPMGVAFADASGRLSDANHAFCQFFGGASLNGQDFSQIVEDGDKATVASLIAKVASGQSGQRAVELRAGAASERMAELFAS